MEIPGSYIHDMFIIIYDGRGNDMMRNISKVGMVKKSRRIVENWTDLILIYLGLKRCGITTLKTRDGLEIRLRNNSTDIQAFAGVWLLEDYNRPGFLPEEGTVIDIGAHIGLYTMFVSGASKNTKIFSFEPASDNYALLRDNIERNSLDSVKTFNMAVSGQSDKKELFLSEDQAGHTLHKKSEKRENVDCITLDKIINDNDIQKIMVLKLDCEGSEYDILNSLSDAGYDKIERICLEYHIINGDFSMRDKLKKNLAGRGFGIEDVCNGELGMIFAVK